MKIITIFQQTNYFIKRNISIVGLLFFLFLISSMHIPLISFIINILFSIATFSIAAFIYNDGNNNINLLKYKNIGTGVTLGAIIVSTLFFLGGTILILFSFLISGGINSILEFSKTGNIHDFNLLVLILPLISLSIILFFFYMLPYFSSLALREKNFEKSLMKFFEIFKKENIKRIFFSLDYFLFTLKYSLSLLGIFLIIFIPISFFLFNDQQIMNSYHNLDFKNIKSILGFITIFGTYSFLITTLYSIMIFYFNIVNIFFIYNLKIFFDGKDNNKNMSNKTIKGFKILEK